MNYRSSNPEVRQLLDAPRYVEWLNFELDHINRQIEQEMQREKVPDHVPLGLLEPYPHNQMVGATLEQKAQFFKYWEKCQAGHGHEIADLLDILASQLPVIYHRYLHKGLTSSNVIDSCNHVRWDKLMYSMVKMLAYHRANVRKNEDISTIPISGYTHGRVAHRTSLWHRWFTSLGSVRLAGYNSDIPDSINGGPTGENTTHRQCYQRYNYWPMWAELAKVAAACEQLATDYRFYCSDLNVGVTAMMKDSTTSSCMPHKANPSILERVCSVSHLVRSMITAQMMLPAQWLDRDLVHSALERETFDRIWDYTFYLVETMDLIVESTPMWVHRPALPSSYDALQERLEKGDTWTQARTEASKVGSIVLDESRIAFCDGSKKK